MLEQVASLLLFSHPRLRARRIRTPVSHVDLAPTLAELLGGEVSEVGAGLSLAPWIVGEAKAAPPERDLYSELATQRAVRRGSHKLIRGAEATPTLAFDLAADPGEQTPVAEGTSWRAELESSLTEFEARPQRVVGSPDIETIDPETRRRLEALGY